jgi:hypothetical protein
MRARLSTEGRRRDPTIRRSSRLSCALWRRSSTGRRCRRGDMYVRIAGMVCLRASGRTLACAEKAQYGPRQASARERARAH